MLVPYTPPRNHFISLNFMSFHFISCHTFTHSFHSFIHPFIHSLMRFISFKLISWHSIPCHSCANLLDLFLTPESSWIDKNNVEHTNLQLLAKSYKTNMDSWICLHQRRARATRRRIARAPLITCAPRRARRGANALVVILWVSYIL